MLEHLFLSFRWLIYVHPEAKLLWVQPDTEVLVSVLDWPHHCHGSGWMNTCLCRSPVCSLNIEDQVGKRKVFTRHEPKRIKSESSASGLLISNEEHVNDTINCECVTHLGEWEKQQLKTHLNISCRWNEMMRHGFFQARMLGCFWLAPKMIRHWCLFVSGPTKNGLAPPMKQENVLFSLETEKVV